MKILYNLALILAVLFLAFTDAGNALAVDLFMRAHGVATDVFQRIYEDSL